jgi:hypothetical protein
MAKAGDQFTVQFTTQNPTTGAAQDADSLPTAVLVKDGVDTAVTVTVAHVATSIYNVSWAIPLAYEAGDVIQIRVTATVAGVTGNDIIWQSTLALGPSVNTEEPHYTTPTFIRQRKINGKIVDLTMFTDAELEEAIVLSEKMIEWLTNDIFYTLVGYTYTFQGKGLNQLFFYPPVPFKLLSLTSVKFVDILSGDEEELTEDTDFVRHNHYLEMTGEHTRSPSRVSFGSSGVFYKGQNNVQITGNWGAITTPPEIRYVAEMLTLERLKPGSTKLNSSDISQASWPDFSISIRGAGEGGSDITGGSTGFPELDRILGRHINYIDMFLALPDSKQTYDNWSSRF